ncbi:MAG: glycosyltransferase family A protein [Pseudomonadota bacterium]
MWVDVAVCTYKRLSIRETLDSISAQILPSDVTLRVLVVENDDQPNMRPTILDHANALGLNLRYVHAPGSNISIARNACLENSGSGILLFIDDDEVADHDWVKNILESWRRSSASVVFGSAIAVYPPDVPAWLKGNDFHSNIPIPNKGIVETGFSSNVLLDRSDERVRGARFDLKFGRTGGEDVDFFFRLHRDNVPMAIANDAIVREPVLPNRTSFRWVLRRRIMTGSIYGTCAASGDTLKRAHLFMTSTVKAAYCGLRSFVAAPYQAKRVFWIMRGSFHAGVAFGCISRIRREVYGSNA